MTKSGTSFCVIFLCQNGYAKYLLQKYDMTCFWCREILIPWISGYPLHMHIYVLPSILYQHMMYRVYSVLRFISKHRGTRKYAVLAHLCNSMVLCMDTCTLLEHRCYLCVDRHFGCIHVKCTFQVPEIVYCTVCHHMYVTSQIDVANSYIVFSVSS